MFVFASILLNWRTKMAGTGTTSNFAKRVHFCDSNSEIYEAVLSYAVKTT